jgi:mannose-6-phosphate isomerase-like protein (cupin superfamily)
MIDSRLVEISEYTGEGYRPLVDYGEWRVAILRYIDELAPENITFLERHNETDEVFVLLEGRCTLLIGDGEEIHAVKMEPYKVYNVKRGVYHSHTLSKDAIVLVVENCDTGAWNSDRMSLGEEQRERTLGEM